MHYQNTLQYIASRYGMPTLCFLCLILSGCANQQLRSQSDKMLLWELHRSNIADIQDWELTGRMAVRLDNEAWSASLVWKQVGDIFEIRIIAPLAQGTVLITGDRDKLELMTSDNQEYSDEDVLRVMQQNLGWSIPVDALKFWVRGITSRDDSVNIAVIDDNGRLVSIEEDEWTINFLRYDLSKKNALPSRIELTRPGTKIRLVINRWNMKSQ